MQTETMTTSETMTMTEPQPHEQVTITTPDGPTTRVLCLLPQYAQTPKRGAKRKDRAEAMALYQYAVTQGGTVDLTPETMQTLQGMGLKPHRVTNAAYKLRKYYGVSVSSTRTGRKVTRYTVTL